MKEDDDAVSLRRELEATRKQMRQLDARLAAHLLRERETLDRLQDAERIASIALLTAGAAVQLRHVARAIASNIDYAARHAQAHEQASCTEAIGRSLEGARLGVARITNLLDEILGERQTHAPAGRTVEVEPLLLACVKLATAAGERVPRFATEFTRTPGIVTDEERLGRALLHLFAHVTRASSLSGESEPTVRVATQGSGNQIAIEVEWREAMPSTETRSALRARRGTGAPNVNLKSCEALIEQLGGSVDVRAAAGDRSVLTLHLPLRSQSDWVLRSEAPRGFASLRPQRHRLRKMQ